jgi:hypothetical protein
MKVVGRRKTPRAAIKKIVVEIGGLGDSPVSSIFIAFSARRRRTQSGDEIYRVSFGIPG